MGKVLRVIRIVVSLALFAILTASLTALGMTFPTIATFISDIQFVPAAMSFSVAVFVGWLLVTLIFGRIYCSTVCPMGTLQDIFARIPRIGRNRHPYRYSPPLNLLRYLSLAIIFITLMAGFIRLLLLVDPYTIYDSFCSTVIRPVLTMTAASFTGALISIVIIAVIGTFATRNGRTFCNSICPVGTTLSFPSRYSIFHIDINPDKCILCRRCESVCKAACIDVPAHTVDSSRCVVCFDCLTDCPNDAIRYTWERHQLSYPLLRSIDGAVTSTSAPAAADKPITHSTKAKTTENENIS